MTQLQSPRTVSLKSTEGTSDSSVTTPTKEEGDQSPAQAVDVPSDSVSREHRERKATKSDSAPVPTYLWEEHLVVDGPTPWSDKQQEDLARAMYITRNVGLRWWKRALFKGFMRWSSQKHRKQIRKAKAWAESKGPVVSWNQSLRVYEWARTKGQSTAQSRFIYRAWSVRRYRATKDYAAGRDALHRALWSSC